MRLRHWLTPDGACAVLSPRQYRAVTVVLLLSVAAFDVVSELPFGFLYLVPIVFTFWGHDRWLPAATAGVASVLMLLGMFTAPKEGIDFKLTMRLGGATIFLGAGWVITNLRRLLAEAREREGVLRTIFDSEPACVKVLGRGYVLLDMNNAGLAMIEAEGIEPLRGHCVLPLVVKEQRHDFEKMCERAFDGEPGMLQFEMVGLKGRRLWVETRMAPLRNAAGHVTAILAVTADVTERRRADEQLRDSEQRLTQAATIAGLGFFEHDHATNAIFWSPGARAILAMDPYQTITHDLVVSMTHPDDRDRALRTVARGRTTLAATDP